MSTVSKMSTNTNEYYLKGLLAQEDKILEEMYDQFFPSILKHIRSNSGRLEDAEDVFQDTLVILYKQAQKGSLDLNSRFSTYLFAVARNQWYKRLRDVYQRETPIELAPEIDNASWEETLGETERQQLVKSKFKELGEGCQQVMRLYLEKRSMQQIAEAMGYKDAGYARKKKCVCQQQLIDLVRKDPRYRELK
ncbi:MAG: sigma-70 family RNA polymerase sigma factor [Saprospiraceae bacterium]